MATYVKRQQALMKMQFKLIILVALIVSITSESYAEMLDVKLGLWRIEPEAANNIRGRKMKYSCITQDALAMPSRKNMLLSCTGTLLTTSTRTIAEWELVCPTGKSTKWKMVALSTERIENFSTPLDYANKTKDNRYSAKSFANWVSEDCGDAPLFPKIK